MGYRSDSIAVSRDMGPLSSNSQAEHVHYFCHLSGVKMTRVSKTSLLNFVVFARFLTLTAKVWQVNDHQKMQRTDHEPIQIYTFQT